MNINEMTKEDIFSYLNGFRKSESFNTLL